MKHIFLINTFSQYILWGKNSFCEDFKAPISENIRFDAPWIQKSVLDVLMSALNVLECLSRLMNVLMNAYVFGGKFSGNILFGIPELGSVFRVMSICLYFKWIFKDNLTPKNLKKRENWKFLIKGLNEFDEIYIVP